MEILARMAMTSNRRIVQEHLDNRKLEKRLNAYENEMIRRVNENCANAIMQRDTDVALMLAREGSKMRILARAEYKAVRDQKRKDTALGCLTFFAYAVLLFWLTSWTYFPVWAAATCVIGSIPILLVYLCRVHGLLPMENVK